jgi:uncharacterized membrane protein YozB (DUF420 family)
MGLFGTGADVWSDLLLLVEVAITAAVLVGIVLIRRGRIKHHRLVMLSTLAVNAVFLIAFLIQDAVAASNTAARGISAPGIVFWPTLVVHLAFAFTAFAIAVAAWRIARRGHSVTPEGRHVVDGQTRRRHRAIARYYPWLWGATLVTGLLLYNVVYVFY